MYREGAEQGLSPGLKRKWWTERKKEIFSGYLYISPFFILFAIFGLFPMLFSFYLAFQKWNGLGTFKYAGLSNLRFVLEDPLFWKSIYNTILFGILGTLPQIIVAIPLAILLNAAWLKLKGFFRMAIFMPYVTSVAAVAIVFSVIFSEQSSGIMNVVLSYIGLEPVSWKTTEWGVKVAISTMVFWRWVGYNTIIFLAGLQRIPPDLYEAATIDGARPIQQLWHITLPLLKPVIVFVTFLSTIGAWQLFVEPLIFYHRISGVREEAMTVVLYLWKEAFVNSAYGTASATAVLLFIIIAIFSILNLIFSKNIGRVN
ncbi:carbohydrate ABC transporter permease [Lihuaxuella thermophila]|uniref:Cellobiose transport system permease protein n=1 Tax=Lihuaxuella thermophila TaxID=1173111 RepID=A0A1H8FE22_9BACL|nr:sugar ABC transporter permease [Lihuaxuella thermophila]SEN29979.1 cellobiose transport system permease protein [Lihuaxuella thermophila]